MSNDPIVELARLVTDPEPVIERFKMSSADQAKLRWLISSRGPMMTVGKINFELNVNGTSREYLIALAQLQNDPCMNMVARETVIADFPVNGNFLLSKGVKPGPGLGAILKQLRLDWFDSQFTLSKQELFERI